MNRAQNPAKRREIDARIRATKDQVGRVRLCFRRCERRPPFRLPESQYWPRPESRVTGPGRRNPPAIPSYLGTHPVVVHVAVKNLRPRSRIRETDCIVVPSHFREGRDHNHIVPGAIQPSMKRNDAILVVHMERVYVFTPQRWLIPPQPDQILCEAVMITIAGSLPVPMLKRATRILRAR
jgi:hypothetical protein